MEGGINAAFVKAWQACENPPLDCTNPHYRNKYASLKATLKVIRDACEPNGLAYRQRLVADEAGRFLASDVIDGSGATMGLSRFPVSQGSNPQAFGSAMTYAKRQQAQADWGIAGEDDDDAETAVNASVNGPFAAHCKSCGARYTFETAEQMAAVKCCPSPNYEIER